MDVSTASDLLATTSYICDDLDRIICLHTSEYIKECRNLRELLSQLRKRLQDLELSEKCEAKEDLVERMKISLSKTFALVEIVGARRRSRSPLHKLNFLFQDELKTLLEAQLSATESLLNHLQHALGSDAAPKSDRSEALFGVNTLDLCTEGKLDKRLIKGDFINIPITGPENRLMYSVYLWVNDPKTVFRHMAKTMSARVECKYQLDPLDEFNYHFPDVFDISMHAKGYNGKLFPKECIAFITLSDVLQAQVKSYLPDCSFPKRPGGLLRRGAVWGLCKNTGQCNAHLRSEKYKAEIWFETAALQGLGNMDLKVLRIQGIKQRKQLHYKCFVGDTGEVLAVYRHDKTAERGKMHFLGMGNQQDVRDIIVSSFVALGLTSQL